jgi:hypothetical protein
LTVCEFKQEREGVHSESISSLSQPPTASLGESFYADCAPQPVLTFKEDPFQQRESFLGDCPMSVRYQSWCACDPKFSPIPGLSFEPYRKFGFAIWDDERMTVTDLGFAEPGRRAFLFHSEYYYVWYCVLTEEDKMLRRSPVGQDSHVLPSSYVEKYMKRIDYISRLSKPSYFYYLVWFESKTSIKPYSDVQAFIPTAR